MSRNNQNQHEDELGFLHDLVDAAKTDAPDEAQYREARGRLLQKMEQDREESFIMNTIKKVTQGRMRWSIASVAAVVIIAVVAGVIPLGSNPNRAYADVVEKLRKAITVSFSAEWTFSENEPTTHVEMAWRAPGIQRVAMELNGAQTIQISDTERNTGIILLPDAKMYVAVNLEAMSSTERDRLEMLKFITKDMRELPDEADEVLAEKEVDGKTLAGFRVGDRSIWIDLDTKSLVSVDTAFGATRMVMRNFQIDSSDLTEADFSTDPPEGYAPVTQNKITLDSSNPGEADLVEFLSTISAMTKSGEFPATPNPLELIGMMKAGLLRDDLPTQTAEEEQATAGAYAQACQKSMIFIMGMKQANDWHYAGKGVKSGDADTPIAWWKPNGSEAYRVLWGDLRFTDLAPGEVPSANKK